MSPLGTSSPQAAGAHICHNKPPSTLSRQGWRLGEAGGQREFRFPLGEVFSDPRGAGEEIQYEGAWLLWGPALSCIISVSRTENSEAMNSLSCSLSAPSGVWGHGRARGRVCQEAYWPSPQAAPALGKLGVQSSLLLAPQQASRPPKFMPAALLWACVHMGLVEHLGTRRTAGNSVVIPRVRENLGKGKSTCCDRQSTRGRLRHQLI
jgi:hypothetical protein